MKSLRIRLILLLGAAIVAAAGAQFAASLRAATREADKLFDYHMRRMAHALQDSSLEQPELHTLPGAGRLGFDFVIQIWTEGDKRVYQSRTYSMLPQQAALGYSNVTLNNGDWRIYAVKTDKRLIQVAQKMDIRRDQALSLALSAVWPIIPISLLLLAVVWWVVTSALAPVNRIGRELAARRADSLAPVSDRDVPQEIARLVAELNSLLGRVGQALQSQQQFVADAAHELRSPLTALKLQVQTLARAKDETARTQAIGRLLGGVDRAARLVEQLLALARQDPLGEPFEPVLVSLPACIEQALADVAPLAASRGITLRHNAVDRLEVLGDADSLRIMVRNLLDNAVRYTPEHGEVQIDLATAAGMAVLTLQDSGSGIPEPERVRVFDRFYRVAGTRQGGSGLGLAIVKAIVDRHKGTVTLIEAALGGLAVRILLPLASAAPQ